jgi:GDPmannose 4,6-dehydratase
VEQSFKRVGIDVEWSGDGVNEIGVCKKTKKTLVKVDPNYFRPTEVELLIGDPSKAEKELNWKHEVTLEALIHEMVDADVLLFKRDKYLLEGGHKVLNYNE